MDPDLLVGVLKNLIESGVVSYSGLTETIEGYSATAYHAVMVANSFLMIRRPPRSTPIKSSAASDVYKRQTTGRAHRCGNDVQDGFAYHCRSTR